MAGAGRLQRWQLQVEVGAHELRWDQESRQEEEDRPCAEKSG